ncbi:hypothetical protein PF007_g17023 [Phytophthora fragariae]|uniref:Uncharacterized protein n=3 Tax=Phytophthora fragariae TaxID=53985 RepID=A0A6A3U864_9STRA|nr:hypothetical protein PF009_g10612 [Phytophthora fragariae]KAE9012381.1 hypothetical protein PF011_g8943 [Phytophthora fragariae]KAE9096389.1 hypothetical protein PF007_g17023 [Phytophthora fragariae]KAE9146348.1 hypothetical protein PF006_g8882 [Phytophthora fragariae]KAE9307629.1 hypothetical protein PF001_g11528 [Phytophthora fragariae]
MLVKLLEPPSVTLEEAVYRATDVSDPIDNVARGMQNIGQPWATSLNPYTILMEGTTGSVSVMPGVGSGMGSAVHGADAVTGGTEGEIMAHFANPQGVYNNFTGTWDVPDGRVWTGKYWKVVAPKRNQPIAPHDGRSGSKRGLVADKKAKVRVGRKETDGSEEEDPRR